MTTHSFKVGDLVAYRCFKLINWERDEWQCCTFSENISKLYTDGVQVMSETSVGFAYVGYNKITHVNGKRVMVGRKDINGKREYFYQLEEPEMNWADNVASVTSNPELLPFELRIGDYVFTYDVAPNSPGIIVATNERSPVARVIWDDGGQATIEKRRLRLYEGEPLPGNKRQALSSAGVYNFD